MENRQARSGVDECSGMRMKVFAAWGSLRDRTSAMGELVVGGACAIPPLLSSRWRTSLLVFVERC